MKSTTQLHELGQSVWLDQISRALLDSGQLRQYIEEFSVTGLTSNPSRFDEALARGSAYDEAIASKVRELD
jgi:transaldolase